MNHLKRNVLVIGSGGREHAICWKLSQSDKVSKIFALPGSYEIGKTSKVTVISDINVTDYPAIITVCKNNGIDIVIVGPEAPLADGITDQLCAVGIHCFGPTKLGAAIEANKSWTKIFMKSFGIPTAQFETFTEVDKAKEFIMSATYEALVVKASGLAAGKGVYVAENRLEACKAVDEILGEKKYGTAGNTIVIEEKLTGEEVSVLAFVDHNTVKVMLPAQDHKRLKNNDSGPMTGGMGAYCPCPLINNVDLEYVRTNIIERAISGLNSSGIKYCGVLYAGLMLTPTGPKILEFNCRFGDPETQVIIPLLETDLFDIMWSCCENRLSEIQLKWKENLTAVGVVMASAGYPDVSTKGSIITGLNECDTNNNDRLIFHSGTAINGDGNYITNGGRVLTNVALANNLRLAARNATKMCENIKFSSSSQQYRTDIAHKAFKFEQLTYKSSGVDIKAGDDLVQRIKPLARGTNRVGVIGGLGGFGGLFQINELRYKNKHDKMVSYVNPVIVETTCGIGTKLLIALDCEQYENIGLDLVAMCSNEILCYGAEPIAFLDYIACGKLIVPIVAQIIKGIADGCRESNCALLGGETAEMPALFTTGSYDLAGYCVGILEYGNEISNNSKDVLNDGDLIIGLPSNGFHCSGFEIIHDIMNILKLNYSGIAAFTQNGLSYAQEFLKPTQFYTSNLLPFIHKGCIKVISHVSNGGLLKNIAKIIPENFVANINAENWKIPDVYGWLYGCNVGLSISNLLEIFNCGVGMCFIVSMDDKKWKNISGAVQIGTIQKNPNRIKPVIINNFNVIIEKIAKKFTKLNVVNKIQLSVDDHKTMYKFTTNINNKLTPTNQSETNIVDCKFANLQKRCYRLVNKSTNKNFNNPILVIGTDGVGTKLKIAHKIKNHSTIGIDLVAMCVNDILCNGAKPLTFLDYYACDRIDLKLSNEILSGVIEGCRQSDCSLIDGKTSEIPLLYKNSEYDLAGFCLGVCEQSDLLPKIDSIENDDVLLALPSTGVHSNGFSLIHKIMELHGLTYNDTASFSACGKTFGEEFLIPTKIYTSAIEPILDLGIIKAIAHITGGGLTENIIRVLPPNLGVQLDFENVHIPPIFGWLAEKGNLSDVEIQKTFNCGYGLILVCGRSDVLKIINSLHLEHGVIRLGIVRKLLSKNEPRVKFTGFTESIQRTQRILVQPKKRIGVLISGNGTNLQALINATHTTHMQMGAEIVCVISNKLNVMGLERARKANIYNTVISNKDFKTREEFDRALTNELIKHNVDIICLAGFMRILSAEFVRKWSGKLINVHPSLLPKHKGLNAQRQALESGDKHSGCTIHFVDEGVDTGQIIYQLMVDILSTDTEETLTQRIHKAEHIAYPIGLRMITTGIIKQN